jgi:hypothetical protein
MVPPQKRLKVSSKIGRAGAFDIYDVIILFLKWLVNIPDLLLGLQIRAEEKVT